MSKLYCFTPSGARRYLRANPLQLVDRADATEFEDEDLIRAAPLAARAFDVAFHVEITPVTHGGMYRLEDELLERITDPEGFWEERG